MVKKTFRKNTKKYFPSVCFKKEDGNMTLENEVNCKEDAKINKIIPLKTNMALIYHTKMGEDSRNKSCR